MSTRAPRLPPLPLWRIPRARYDLMVTRGILQPDTPVELLDGLLVVREPQGSRHAVVVGLVRAALEPVFGPSHHVREEKPVALDDLSEPEPDLVVVRGRLRDYLEEHPSSPVLIVEVADTSVALDRLRKGGLYARAGIPDYWIVNLQDDLLEVYRQPARAPARPYGWEYKSVRLLRKAATVSPLARPRARIRVADLLA